MKTPRWHRLGMVVPTVIVSFLISGAAGVLVTKPSNAVGLLQDSVTFECSSDQPFSISWSYDSAVVSGPICSWTSPNFVTANNSASDCYLNVKPDTSRLSGPYSCSDGTVPNAQAVLIVMDPTPTCEVTTSQPIVQGQTVTLSCSMTYYCKSPPNRLDPGAGIAAAISWESGAGTEVSKTATDQTNTAGEKVGETLQVDVQTTVSGTEIPSYNCTSTFQFTDMSDPLFTFALNTVSWTCASTAVTLWYCPSSVTISPSSGPFNAGDVLTCSSDGYPQPSYMWTDSGGAVVSTTNTMTLSGGSFDLTCTATGNFTTPCSASSSSVSGFAVACPQNLMASPAPTPELIVNTVVTCSSTGGEPSPSYYWLKGTQVVSTSATISITDLGDFFLTCVANSSYDGLSCVETFNISGTAVLMTTTSSTTTGASTTTSTANTANTATAGTGTTTLGTGTTQTQVPYTGTGSTSDLSGFTGTTSNTTDTGSSSLGGLNMIMTIVFSILTGLALVWMFLLLCCWPELTDGRRKRRRQRRWSRRYRWPYRY